MMMIMIEIEISLLNLIKSDIAKNTAKKIWKKKKRNGKKNANFFFSALVKKSERKSSCSELNN